jgi:hypothetical protein
MLLRDCRLMIYSSIVSLYTYNAPPPSSHTANWTVECNPLVYNSEDWSIPNDLEFGFMSGSLPSLSSPLELEPESALSSPLESPISGSPFTNAEDLFDKTRIDSNDLPRHLYNKPAATCGISLLVSTDH